MNGWFLGATRRSIAWLVVSATCMASLPCRSADLACQSAAITVSGTSNRELALACAAVESAIAFLAPAGLTLEHGPPIRLVAQMPGRDDMHAMAQYDAQRHAVDVLDYRTAVVAYPGESRPFKVEMSEALWQSYVAHEVAHVVLRAADPSRRLSVARHEYVAAVVQLGTLPDGLRSTILQKYCDVPAFADASELSDLYYFFAPCAFAVKSYRHYIAPGNGPAFIARLVSEGVRPR